MRLRVLSRASDLARLQARLVGDALQAADSSLSIEYLQRRAGGDVDQRTPLAAFDDKGAFTADLSDALAAGHADLVVHSWKDLPIAARPDTIVAATLPRADPRDVLIVRDATVRARPRTLTVLSSSPRRAWLLQEALPSLLPWSLESVTTVPVRGNVPTRLRKLLEGDADALVVAKAALDRLLAAAHDPAGAAVASSVRGTLASCRWMVLPIRDVPTAPGQGALAVEIATAAGRVREILDVINHQPTWRAVTRERDELARHGGGCHAAFGATVLVRAYGEVLSLRACLPSGCRTIWELASARPKVPPAAIDRVWPTPADRDRRLRSPLDVDRPDADALLVTRADALPRRWTLDPDTIVWTAGGRTWSKLARRGVWVHGCADGLGDAEDPHANLLAGRRLRWCRLTHANAAAPEALATYRIDHAWPPDLPARTHFFWTSGSELQAALSRWPELSDRWHGCGPGRTAQAMSDLLGPSPRCGVWIDYEHWLREVTPA